MKKQKSYHLHDELAVPIQTSLNIHDPSRWIICIGVKPQVTQAHCVRHVGIKIKRTYEAKFRSENLLENGNKNR